MSFILFIIIILLETFLTQAQITQGFSCYTCTLNVTKSQFNLQYPNSTSKYQTSSANCGLNFQADNSIEQILCTTSCLKRVTGIQNNVLNVERRCVTQVEEKSICEEKISNLINIIDNIYCCNTNLCNKSIKNLNLCSLSIYLFSILLVLNVFFNKYL